MDKNRKPNKIVKLVFEEVSREGECTILKVYLEPTERPLDAEMADSEDVTLAEAYSSEVMEMVTELMMRQASHDGVDVFKVDPKKDLN